MELSIGSKLVGDGHPAYIIAEAGINHQGDLDIAKELVRLASINKFDSIKFQKRDTSQWPETPYYSNTFGLETTYRHHKELLEFNQDQYAEIVEECVRCNIDFSVSVWDITSYEWIKGLWATTDGLTIPYIKIPSACLTDHKLIKYVYSNYSGIIILSTGMSTVDEIDSAMKVVNSDSSRIILMHCNSSYPSDNAELNLRCIPMLRDRYGCLVGYSGHEPGIQASLYAVALGASVIEKHITYDRSAPGTDHAASLEYDGQRRLVRDIKLYQSMLGDGVKRVYESEVPVMRKLRYKEL
jgi:N-acetylneuraminate synthase